MANNPDTHPKEEMAIPVSDTPHAPFIFYENAPLLVSQMGSSISRCRPTTLGSARTAAL
jgi:hypothetical protein